MGMSIYEIDNAIMSCVDAETGEIIDEQALESLQMERDAKIENIGCWIKNLKAEAEAVKAEKMNLAKRQQALENKAESLKNYLSWALDGQKFSTGKVAISYRKSSSVDVADVHALEIGGFDEYLKYSEPTPDKTKIKEAIQAGVELPGCAIVEKLSVQIK